MAALLPEHVVRYVAPDQAAEGVGVRRDVRRDLVLEPHQARFTAARFWVPMRPAAHARAAADLRRIGGVEEVDHAPRGPIAADQVEGTRDTPCPCTSPARDRRRRRTAWRRRRAARRGPSGSGRHAVDHDHAQGRHRRRARRSARAGSTSRLTLERPTMTPAVLLDRVPVRCKQFDARVRHLASRSGDSSPARSSSSSRSRRRLRLGGRRQRSRGARGQDLRQAEVDLRIDRAQQAVDPA